MSEPIPAIESAYLNMSGAAKRCRAAMDAWETDAWPTCLEFIEWAIEDLEAAKGKIERHNKTNEE